MVQRFSGPTEPDAEQDDLLRQMKDNRNKLSRIEQDRASLQEELADIPRLEEQVNRFKETNLPTRLQEQRRLAQDEAVFTEGNSRLRVAREFLDDIRGDELVEALLAEIDNIEGSTEEATLQRVAGAVEKLGRTVQTTVEALDRAILVAEAEIQQAKTDWTTRTDPMRAVHAEVRRQLVDEGHNPDKYLTSTKALEALKAKSPRLKTFDTQLTDLQIERDRLLGELAANEAKQAERLNEAIRQANRASTGVVVVRPVASPKRGDLKRVVEQHVRGQRTQIMAAIDVEDFSPRAFVAVTRGGVEQLKSGYNIRGAQAAAIVAAGEDLFRELEEMSVGQAVDVLLNVAPTGGPTVLHKLEDLSKGQRATALLMLLLGASSSPLVIDQPEDDLDNRFVYDGIVQKLRELKGTRQIIASTHNANVPVLGDAELIIALEGDGLKGWSAEGGVGSLDDPKVREYAEQLLEGGRAAFDARQHLYGF